MQDGSVEPSQHNRRIFARLYLKFCMKFQFCRPHDDYLVEVFAQVTVAVVNLRNLLYHRFSVILFFKGRKSNLDSVAAGCRITFHPYVFQFRNAGEEQSSIILRCNRGSGIHLFGWKESETFRFEDSIFPGQVIHRTETELVVHFCQRIVGDIHQGHPGIMSVEIRPYLS